MKNVWSFGVYRVGAPNYEVQLITRKENDFPWEIIPIVKNMVNVLMSSYFTSLCLQDGENTYLIGKNKEDDRKRYSLMRYFVKVTSKNCYEN